MKAIDGKLSITDKYEIKDIYIAGTGDFDFRICENCGKIIKNIALVENQHGKVFEIGLDCAEVLSNLSNNYSITDLQIKQAKKILARRRRFLKELKEAGSLIINLTDDVFFFYKGVVSEWQVYYRGAGKYSFYKKLIDSLNIPKTYITEIN